MKIIGVAGGSGSGKTTFAKMLMGHLGPERAVILLQDSYYIDRSKQFHGDGSLNFDHPNVIDWTLMIQHLQDLRAGRAVEVPIYDFATHSRKSETVRVQPKEFVVVDGILIFSPPGLREIFDRRIFIDTAEPVRFARRLHRDVEERGRTPEGVRVQYDTTVRPMHDEFVEPTKTLAHDVISGESPFDRILQELCSEIS